MTIAEEPEIDAGGDAGFGAMRWGRVPSWWLDHPAVDADALAVLTALSSFANRQGRCWPSQTTLAAKLKRGRAWVNRIIARLEDAGLLTSRDRWSENGGRLSCLYELTLTPPADTAAAPVCVPHPPVAPRRPPCAAERHEQPESEHNPDSPQARAPAQTPDEDWTPNAADRQWAQNLHGDVDLDRHIAAFRLRCRAHGYRYRDIGAAWRAWLTQDAAAGKAPAAGSSSRPRQREAVAEQSLNAWMAVAARLQTAHS